MSNQTLEQMKARRNVLATRFRHCEDAEFDRLDARIDGAEAAADTDYIMKFDPGPSALTGEWAAELGDTQLEVDGPMGEGCGHCGDAGVVRMNGEPVDCPDCNQ